MLKNKVTRRLFEVMYSGMFGTSFILLKSARTYSTRRFGYFALKSSTTLAVLAEFRPCIRTLKPFESKTLDVLQETDVRFRGWERSFQNVRFAYPRRRTSYYCPSFTSIRIILYVRAFKKSPEHGKMKRCDVWECATEKALGLKMHNTNKKMLAPLT